MSASSEVPTSTRFPVPSPRLLPLFMASAVACTSPVDQGPERIVGLIEDVNPAINPLVLPDTAHLDVPFTAMVTTFGPSCLRADGADVRTTGLLAGVTPYDLSPSPDAVCTQDIRALPRAVLLTFGTTGSAIVQLHGRGLKGNVTLQRSVTVRP